MATKVAIAMRQAEALKRVEVAVAAISERFGLPPVDLAPQMRDPGLARAAQIEAFAELLESLVVKVQAAGVVEAVAAVKSNKPAPKRA